METNFFAAKTVEAGYVQRTAAMDRTSSATNSFFFILPLLGGECRKCNPSLSPRRMEQTDIC
jgi:hypothetical protein